jgi:hypothetical protein
MSDSYSENAWDEFRWERFLQDQERRTEKYMELLDQYMDHPERDEIIAREMGWNHMIGGESREWEEEVDAAFEDEGDDIDREETEDGEPSTAFSFERHPIYMAALAFNGELDELLDNSDEKTREHPAMNALNNHVIFATSKLAAALTDDEVEELGMSIAYLKRAVAAINLALDAAMHLFGGALVTEEAFQKLRRGLFGIRNDIITTMGEYRAEFRRRHGTK